MDRHRDGNGTFSAALEARGDVATKGEPLTAQAHPTPQNCPLINPPAWAISFRAVPSEPVPSLRCREQ